MLACACLCFLRGIRREFPRSRMLRVRLESAHTYIHTYLQIAVLLLYRRSIAYVYLLTFRAVCQWRTLTSQQSRKPSVTSSQTRSHTGKVRLEIYVKDSVGNSTGFALIHTCKGNEFSMDHGGLNVCVTGGRSFICVTKCSQMLT